MNKKRITIPVTPFVYAAVSSVQGSDTIVVDQKTNKDIAFLCQVAPINPAKKKIALLTKTITLVVSYRMHEQLKSQNLEAIGLLWHRHYLFRMYSFIEAQVLAGKKAYTALEDYLYMHKIDEDAWSVDSGYRGWLTFQKSQKQTKKSQNLKNGRSIDLSDILSTSDRFRAKYAGRKVKAAYIEELTLKILDEGTTLYNYGRNKKSDVEKRAIIIYLLSHICRLSHAQIGSRIKRSKSTVTGLLQNPQERFATSKLFVRTLEKVFARLESVPLSVLTRTRRA